MEGALDGRQFERFENLSVIIPNKRAQVSRRVDPPGWQRTGPADEGGRSARRADLLDERIKITEQFRRVRRWLCLMQHFFSTGASLASLLFNAAPLHSRMPAVKMPRNG